MEQPNNFCNIMLMLFEDYIWPEGEEMSPRATGASIGSFASFSSGSYREAARQDSVRRRQQSNQAKQQVKREKRIQHPTPPAAPDTSHPQTYHPGANIPPPPASTPPVKKPLSLDTTDISGGDSVPYNISLKRLNLMMLVESEDKRTPIPTVP